MRPTFHKTTAVALALGLLAAPVLAGCAQDDSTPDVIASTTASASTSEKLELDVSKIGSRSDIARNVRIVDYADLYERLRAANTDPVNIIDVRTVREYELGHLKDAVNLPLSKLKLATSAKLATLLPKDGEIWVYCRSGARAKEAATIIHTALPYRLVFVVQDNFDAASSYGLKVVEMTPTVEAPESVG